MRIKQSTNNLCMVPLTKEEVATCKALLRPTPYTLVKKTIRNGAFCLRFVPTNALLFDLNDFTIEQNQTHTVLRPKNMSAMLICNAILHDGGFASIERFEHGQFRCIATNPETLNPWSLEGLYKDISLGESDNGH